MGGQKDAGFLFCFKKASQIDTSKETKIRVLFQRLIQMCTNTDIVHVEIIAVIKRNVSSLIVDECSYNTLLNPGFHKSYDRLCLGPAYEIVYMPMSKADTDTGIEFLDSLLGYTYNIFGLGSAWLRQFIPDHVVHTHGELIEQVGHSVFCTQAALRVCYLTKACRDDILPELCTPAQLHDILLKNGAARIQLRKIGASSNYDVI